MVPLGNRFRLLLNLPQLPTGFTLRAFTHRALKIAEAMLLAIEEWERCGGLV